MPQVGFLLTVDEADALLKEHALAFGASLGTEACDLARASDRVLRESVVADRDLPPFDRVMMDGIVVAWDDLLAGRTTFALRGCLAAGRDPFPFLGALDAPGGALEIMTGAPLPGSVARLAVIPVEDIDIEQAGQAGTERVATLRHRPEMSTREHGRFVHPRAFDARAGSELLRPGRRMASVDIAVAATCGRTTLRVSRRPSITILATGDELVGVHENPAPHQIRVSNALMLASVLGPCGPGHDTDLAIVCVGDDESALLEAARAALARSDAVVLSGGVSMGRFDVVPRVLERLGVTCLFHKIRQRPGKPLWFGTRLAGETPVRAVFGLPGNPSSALLCAFRYVMPFFMRAEDGKDLLLARPRARLQPGEEPAPADLTQFLPVHLPLPGVARRIVTNGSGDFVNLLSCDGFLEWRAGASREQNSEPHPVTLIRPMSGGAPGAQGYPQ